MSAAVSSSRRPSNSGKSCFPPALPAIFVGIRLGLIFALINVVGVEFLINFGGLGQLINELAERYDLPGTYAAICFVVLVSVCSLPRPKGPNDG
jgi:NitT/TauT family transport system permease protein